MLTFNQLLTFNYYILSGDCKIGRQIVTGEPRGRGRPTWASRRAAMREWRESRRVLIMRSFAWYSINLPKSRAAAAGRMRITQKRCKLAPSSVDIRRRTRSYLLLTHMEQQEGRLDPSQSAQLLLRRDAILLAPVRREGRGIAMWCRDGGGQITGGGRARGG
jgi:hypothetical protein